MESCSKLLKNFVICGSEISAATVEHHFNLLQCGHHGVQPAVLLGFLVQAKFENGVAQTLYAVQHHAAAKGKGILGYCVAFEEHRALAGEARRVGIGDVVGRDVERSLLRQQAAYGN